MIASFDIGIKNMAYCILDTSSDPNNPIIKDWNVINLIQTNSVTHTCNQTCKNKKICGKTAKFVKNNNYYCNIHAKNSGFIIPSKKTTLQYFKKQKKDELIKIANMLFINIDNMNRDIIIEKINKHYENNSLEIINNKKIKANDVDLVSIGKSIKLNFNNIPIMKNIGVVLIENQISPIANRMKTIQGMLAQYFIMNYDNIQIEFISSSGKLKGLSKENENLDSNYKQNKKDAIFHCSQYLEKDIYKEWSDILNTDKKDDLADCFLQGISWINKKNKK
jgi:hypothetical protein